MKQSTKDNIIGAISGAIVTGIFSFALFYLGNYTNRSTIEKDIVNTLSESFDSIDKDMSYVKKMNFLNWLLMSIKKALKMLQAKNINLIQTFLMEHGAEHI